MELLYSLLKMFDFRMKCGTDYSLFWPVLQRFMVYHAADGQFTTNDIGNLKF